MYHSEIAEPIQNDKCCECKFEGWDAERGEDVCSIKGCWHNSKFVPFSFDKWVEEVEEKRNARR